MGTGRAQDSQHRKSCEVDQRVPNNTESWGGVRCEDQGEDDDAGDAFLTIEEQQNLETFMYDSDANESDQVTGYE